MFISIMGGSGGTSELSHNSNAMDLLPVEFSMINTELHILKVFCLSVKHASPYKDFLFC